jgi:hypothetical protein
MPRPPTATWNREDRDLLIELRTQMTSMFGEIAGARLEIKEINTGITAPLLNLESNSVSKIEINPRLDEIEQDVTGLKTAALNTGPW